MAVNRGRQQADAPAQNAGPLSVAGALELYRFRPYRAGHPFPWEGGGLVLICCQVLPAAESGTSFRILEAVKAERDATRTAGTRLRECAKWTSCSATSLFALIAAVPDAVVPALLYRLEDAILGQRIFSLPEVMPSG